MCGERERYGGLAPRLPPISPPHSLWTWGPIIPSWPELSTGSKAHSPRSRSCKRTGTINVPEVYVASTAKGTSPPRPGVRHHHGPVYVTSSPVYVTIYAQDLNTLTPSHPHNTTTTPDPPYLPLPQPHHTPAPTRAPQVPVPWAGTPYGWVSQYQQNTGGTSSGTGPLRNAITVEPKP